MSQQMIVIAGAKGGVGRSTLAVNLSWSLAVSGTPATLVDANLGLANDDILLGLCPEMSVKDILRGTALEEVAVRVRPHFTLIPAAAGDYEAANANALAVEGIFYDLEHGNESGFLIVDTEASLSERTRHLLHCADQVVLVTTPEAASLANAYATAKLVASRRPPKEHFRMSVLVNQTRTASEGAETFEQLQRLIRKYLALPLEFAGAVPFDDKVRESVRTHRAVVDQFPKAKASLAIRQWAESLRIAGKAPEIRPTFLEEILKSVRTGVLSHA